MRFIGTKAKSRLSPNVKQTLDRVPLNKELTRNEMFGFVYGHVSGTKRDQGKSAHQMADDFINYAQKQGWFVEN